MHESTSQFIHRMRIDSDPVSDPAAKVVVGDARFTVLTSRLVRMEYDPEGAFEDRASFAFPNRRSVVPEFEVHQLDGTTVIDTGALVLRYQPDGRSFHPGNLTVALATGARWAPGMRDRRNLGGARRTVDTCRGDARLEPGLASRSGWAVHDDSTSALFDTNGWVTPRDVSGPELDWYFFGYGHEYPAAVADYTTFGGAVPLLPRWMLGAWWSRYWAYTDAELRALVEEFATRDLPLDVLVVDMDWHLPDSWTGYSWNRELFPDPRAFLAWLHSRGLHTTLNLHPALGVQAFEDAYPEFAAAMGVDPASGAPIPFQIADPDYMRNYFGLLHHPLEDDGVDFWWMDWQQGRKSEGSGIDPLPWLNHLHFTDSARHQRARPTAFSRWGGLGSHRYPIGFSGDSFAQWSALQFQPRYTAAGANVGYGWWSHDIGGHIGADDPELYVRWVQFGAFSPILRLHSNQHPESERRPWMFGADALDATRAAFHARYELVPYLYSAARIAADTGISLVRPMSWAAPEDDSAYVARFQYLLGDSLLVAPIVHPADPANGLAATDVWLPAGEWVERTTGERSTGPCWTRQVADLMRIPQFVRVGTVLPLAEVAATTADQPKDHLVLSVFPGAPGSTRVYDDDGTSSEFRRGDFSWTTVTTESPDATRCSVTVEPGIGADLCRYTVRLEHTHPPDRVTVDGLTHHDWSHDASTTTVEIGPRPRSAGVHIEVGSDSTLSMLGEEHNRRIRAADVRALLADESVATTSPSDESIQAVVRALATHDPARAHAIARIGGPLIRVFEHTAPDDAADVLGRVVVAAGTGATSTAHATWSLQRGGRIETVTSTPVEVGPAGTVFDAPFRWDGSLDPARWSVQVRATWDDDIVTQQHQSAVLMPSLSSWRVASEPAEVAPAVEDVLDDLDARALTWRVFQTDPFDIDFADLPQRYDIALQHDPTSLPDRAYVVHALTRLDVVEDTGVSFEYFSSDSVDIYLDGTQIRADVTGTPPTAFYELSPAPRRSELVHVARGRHTLLVRCVKAAEVRWPEWRLSMSVVTSTGDTAFGVTGSAD